MAIAVAAVVPTDSVSWDKGMDDNAGRAATSAVDVFDLPGATNDNTGGVYPVRDRFYVTSLDGTWAFKLVEGLNGSDGLDGWNQPGYDVSAWDDIRVPGNWDVQGFSNPRYGNQVAEQTGLYVRCFRSRPEWRHERVFVRFDGVLFSYRVWVNGKEVGAWGSAYNLAQFEVTEALVEGRNTIAVEVKTRSKGWLFDTNDCWGLCGIFRSVELFTVPKQAAIQDVVFNFDGEKVETRVTASGDYARVYVSLVDEDGLHVADSEQAKSSSLMTHHAARVAAPHLWSPASPYLYNLVVTLVDAQGRKIQRVVEKVGLRTVKLEGLNLLVNGEKVFLNGVAWNEIDPLEGRAISYKTCRAQMTLMKKAGVNAIRTAHYPFGPDFLELADEMGFFVIDEVPFGSRGREFLTQAKYRDELLGRTRATILRDKNHPSVIFWTFGNENPWTKNTAAVLAYAKELDPTRPRGLPQIGSSQFHEMLYHPERDVDFIAGHYLNRDRMREAEEHTQKPMVQTEFAHACGNGFCDFAAPYTRMRQHPDKWMGGFIWVWADQAVMHPFAETDEGLARRNQLKYPDGTEVPKDLRRDLPAEFQGNHLDAHRFIDSWGDRGTDGIVYGDGTPKDAYWLVKKLYTAPDSFFTNVAPHEARQVVLPKPSSKQTPALLDRLPLLRIGRKMGMDQRIQSLRKWHSSCQQPYLVAPEVQTNGLVRYYLSRPSNRSAWLEGTVTWRAEEGKTVVAYELQPNEAARERDVLELGLVFAMPAEATRVDWVGLGPLTSVPNKWQMNAHGLWAMHKDDYRFIGPRAEVGYACATTNGGSEGVVLESGTGKVSFENLDGRIYLTECVHVAGYGGKSSPSGTRKLKELTVKGEVKLYRTAVDPATPHVVPDWAYAQHYGF